MENNLSLEQELLITIDEQVYSVDNIISGHSTRGQENAAKLCASIAERYMIDFYEWAKQYMKKEHSNTYHSDISEARKRLKKYESITTQDLIKLYLKK